MRELTVLEREVDLHDRGASYVMRIRPYRSVERVIEGVVMTFVDVTARKEAERAKGVSERRFTAIVDEASVGVAETDLDGRFLLTNAAFEAMVGRSAGELQRLRRHELMDPEDAEKLDRRFEQAARGGQPFESEYRLRRADGTNVWVHDSISVLSDNDGRANSVISVTLEIDERKRSEEQTTLLLGELDHRVKNILAIVSSIVTQTLKTNPAPEAFAATIAGRIGAITRAHSLLANPGAASVGTLRELINTELEPYQGRDLRIEGPVVALTPRAGLAVAMAIHELASNAAKYGSLSSSQGQLAVSWEVTNGSDRRLRLSWTESGGPLVPEVPSQRGFGTTLIERSLSFEFDAEVDRRFAPSGVVCIIDLPFTSDVGELRPAARGS